MITHEQARQFHRDGFLVAPDMFSSREVAVILAEVERTSLEARTVDLPDAGGRSARAALWTSMPEGVFGLVTSSPRLVNSARVLLQDDVYHWHSKIMFKEARSGGSWEWHQDYGYWYDAGCLYPSMLSAFVVLDESTRENGCVQYLRGSHLLGRLDHVQGGGQPIAEQMRLKHVQDRLELVYGEAKPGTVVFHHALTLHGSQPNTSDKHRRGYVVAFNAMSNESVDRGMFPSPESWVPGADAPNALLDHAAASAR